MQKIIKDFVTIVLLAGNACQDINTMWSISDLYEMGKFKSNVPITEAYASVCVAVVVGEGPDLKSRKVIIKEHYKDARKMTGGNIAQMSLLNIIHDCAIRSLGLLGQQP